MPDRKQAIFDIERCTCNVPDACRDCSHYGNPKAPIACMEELMIDAYALLKEQPEIVRCKDCKHSEHWYGDKQRCFLWDENGIDVFEDGFCSYGKRVTDDA